MNDADVLVDWSDRCRAKTSVGYRNAPILTASSKTVADAIGRLENAVKTRRGISDGVRYNQVTDQLEKTIVWLRQMADLDPAHPLTGNEVAP
jgi:hypothetical protein